MFGKQNQQSIEKFKKIETLISHNTEFKGIISSKGSLRIDGIFEGTIEHADGVIIGETGIIKGDINAQNVVTGGKINGNITAAETIEILPTGQMYGDINSATLSISEGAIFEGNCTMSKRKANGHESNSPGIEEQI
jgi:cytoskeletal protein CcmA (bactofilin family)